MSTVVLVHGIAQEQRGANTLERDWVPALADGVRVAGYDQLADRMWRAGRSDTDIRMAFYGDLFVIPGTMGAAAEGGLPDGEQMELAAGLATEWLNRAVEREHPDARAAATQLSYVSSEEFEEQGRRAEAKRAVVNGVAKVRWFAPFGMRFAGRFVNETLRQVTAYLTDEKIRNEVQRRVAAHIDGETKILIGHSLGSVVAYEAAHRLTSPLPLLLTLGSPLGLRTIVYDRVRPPAQFPPRVRRWVNVADRNDLVAAQPDLGESFGKAIPAGARFDAGWTVVNGAKPHDASFYLTKEQIGRPIGEVLAD